jgi:hypothetical protein
VYCSLPGRQSTFADENPLKHLWVLARIRWWDGRTFSRAELNPAQSFRSEDGVREEVWVRNASLAVGSPFIGVPFSRLSSRELEMRANVQIRIR